MGNTTDRLIQQATEIQCDRELFLRRVASLPPVLPLVLAYLTKSKLDFRILSVDQAPFIKLRINSSPEPKEISIFTVITIYVSKLVPIVHERAFPFLPHWEDDDYDERTRNLLDRNKVSSAIYEILSAHGYVYFHASHFDNAAEADATLLEGSQEMGEWGNLKGRNWEMLFFGDLFAHSGMGKNPDWDSRRQSEDENEPDHNWLDEPLDDDERYSLT